MKNNIIRNILTVAAVFALTTACKGFLDEQDQSKFIPVTPDHYSSALLGEFNMSYAPFYMIQYMTDEMRDGVSVSENNSGREQRRPAFCWQRDIEKNMTDFSRMDFSSYWAYCYKMIAICNNIFENIDNTVESVAGEKAFVLAEADFVEALLYFNLVNLYAEPYRAETASHTMGIPLREGTGIEDAYDRSMLDVCYDKIIALLTESLVKIKESGLDYKTYHKISEDAVRIVLSRVFLFMGQWDNVIATLEPIMPHASLQKFPKDGDTWVEGSREVVYTYGLYTYNRIKDDCNDYYFNGSEEMFGLYDENDLRRNLWFKYSKDPDTGGMVVIPKKGEVTDRLGQIVIRYGEAYLNIAEAYARKNDLRNASEYLSKFLPTRRSSIGGDVQIPTGQKELISFIFDERFREFCYEDHCRWFDLRRMDESERPLIIHKFRVMRGAAFAGEETFRLMKNDPNYTLALPYKEKDNNPMILDYDRFDKVSY